MTALQAIVFDFDGVIANSEPLHLRAFQLALAEEGIALSRREYFSRYLGFDDVGMFDALARDRSLPMTDRQVAGLVARKGAQAPGADASRHGSVSRARKNSSGLRRRTCQSQSRPERCDTRLTRSSHAAGLSELFTTIVASGDTPESKPSPAPYLLAFQRLQERAGGTLDPRRCVAIEDSRWGLDSARGAGLRCVGVTTSYPAHELAGAELVVEGLDELTLVVLDRLCNGHHEPARGSAP